VLYQKREAPSHSINTEGIMKTRILALLAVSVWFAVPGSAFAAGPGDSGFYAGAGIGFNSLDGGGDATGFQMFGGYDLAKAGFKAAPFKLAVEVGYMDSGTFESDVNIPLFGTVRVQSKAKGLWATGVASYPVNPQTDLIGRLGLDFGDDDGLMLGAGVGFSVNKQMQLRGEYVIRDHIDSLQLNLILRL
jgi:hypothetical protein